MPTVTQEDTSNLLDELTALNDLTGFLLDDTVSCQQKCSGKADYVIP